MARIPQHVVSFVESLPRTKEFWLFVFAVLLGVVVAASIFLRLPGVSVLSFVLGSIGTIAYAMCIYVVICYQAYERKVAHPLPKEQETRTRALVLRETIALALLFPGALVGLYFLITQRLIYAGATFFLSAIIWAMVRYFVGRHFDV